MAGQNISKKLDIQKIISELTAYLPERTKDIIEKRFGLLREEPMTLEAIGQKYGVTRERVRQIEKDGLSLLKQPKNFVRLSRFFELVKDYLRNHGDFREERALYKELGPAVNLTPAQFYFALSLNNQDFKYISESQKFHSVWTINENSVQKVQKAIANIVKDLQAAGRPAVRETIFAAAAEHLQKAVGFSQVSEKIVGSALSSAKNISSNPFGEYGLSGWADINPRGVRDKAYLVLKKHGKPLHFKEVAEHITRIFAGLRSAHPQTVHNELIKDSRFVLIGRGIYALMDWGFEPGTVKDVLLSIFKKHSRPLTKEDIVKKIAAQRLVKTNTIFLNLQNKNYFRRTGDGKYALKEWTVEET